MKCEEFILGDYIGMLIDIAKMSSGGAVRFPAGMRHKKPSALEYYLHCDSCPQHKEEFESYIEKYVDSKSEDYGLIYEGVRVVGSIVGDGD